MPTAIIAPVPGLTSAQDVGVSIDPLMLMAVLGGDIAAREALADIHEDPSVPVRQRPIRRLAWAVIRYFEVDDYRVSLELIEDAIQEFWVRLFQKKPGSFDPARGSARTFAWMVMRDSVRDVLDFERIPHNPRGRVDPRSRLKVIRLVLDAAHGEPDHEAAGSVADASDGIADFESRMLLDELLTAMPPRLARVVVIVANDGCTMSEAGAIVGVSRFAARRMAAKWATHLRHVTTG